MSFREQFCDQAQLTTVWILYHRPDYRSLLQEFIWQALDVPPKFQRIHRFLEHWRTQIRVPIREVRLSVSGHLMPVEFIPATIYSC